MLEVFKELMPDTDHTFCIRYMPVNVKKNGPIVKTLKGLMWKASRAYKKNKHKYYIDNINCISNMVHALLPEFKPRDWHRYVN